MGCKSILKIKDRKRFLKELEESKKRNFEDNMKFAKLYALWMKRKSDKDWSRRQKAIIDRIYRSNRRRRAHTKKFSVKKNS